MTYKMKLAHLKQGWNAPAYAFFKSTPDIEYFNDRQAHVFTCLAKSCKGKGKFSTNVNHFVNKGDASSTSNLQKHAKICWGEDVLVAADKTRDVSLACGIVAKSGLGNASITAMFDQAGKATVSYSHRQHTKTETKLVLNNYLTF